MKSIAYRLDEPPVSEAAVTADILRTMPLGTEPPPAVVAMLLTALAQHDGLTYLHSLRVGRRAWELTLALGGDEDQAARNFLAGLLHDLGKVNTPRAILNKADALTPSEWAMVRAHPEEGARMLAFAPELRGLAPVIAAHHERPDGQGYPYGYSISQIPPEAFVISVADAIEAMASKRPYAPAMSKETIAKTLIAGAGTCWETRTAMIAAHELVRSPALPNTMPAADRYVRMPLLVPVPS